MSHNTLVSALPAHRLKRERKGEHWEFGKCRKRDDKNEDKMSA